MTANTNTKIKNLDHKDWEKAFKMIELENHLANHRFSGLLKLQGFLFAGLMLGLNSFAKCEYKVNEQIVGIALLLICIVGAISPIMVFSGLKAAYRQICASAAWLRRITNDTNYKLNSPYPPIIGIPIDKRYEKLTCEETDKINELTVGILKLKWLLSGIWALFFLAVLWFLSHPSQLNICPK